MWFENLTGFREESPQHVRNNLIIEGKDFVSLVNHRRFTFGELEVLSLEELRTTAAPPAPTAGKLEIREVVADVQRLHVMEANADALFQVASQFNLLEMVGPHVTPEQGIGRYEHDHTQGPACAIACGAGTIYRNYFVPLGDQIGQTADRQVDGLALMGKELGNEKRKLWRMSNGYALVSREGLSTINKLLAARCVANACERAKRQSRNESYFVRTRSTLTKTPSPLGS